MISLKIVYIVLVMAVINQPDILALFLIKIIYHRWPLNQASKNVKISTKIMEGQLRGLSMRNLRYHSNV